MTAANHLVETGAKKIVERFVCRFDESYRLLLYYAAIPLILTPELLNYLRHQFLRGKVLWVAEVDLLLSDLFNPVGYELYAMDTAVRAYLLQNIEDFFHEQGLDPQHFKEVALILLGYIKYLKRTNSYLGDPELQAQQWAALVYLEDKKEQVFQEIKQAFRDCISEAELERLTQITQELSPQLSNYPSLIQFAKLMRDFLLALTSDLTKTRQKLVQLGQTLEIDLSKFPKFGLSKPGKNWAIAIGINQYEHFNHNQYAVRDAEAMRGWFRQSGFAEVHSLSETNYAAFQGFLSSHFQRASLTPNDVFWFYFSGLGVTVGDRDYLLFSDSNLEDLEKTAISLGALSKRLLESGAGRLILLLDADRWGQWQYGKQRETLPSASTITQALIRQSGIDPKKQELIVFYACLPDEGAYEIKDFQHGLLTYAFQEVVQNWRGENVSAEGLYQSLYQRVVQLAKQHIRASQTPALVAEPDSLREQILLLAPTFTFETVTLDRRGEEIKHEPKTARYYTEDLGNGITLDMVAVPGGKFKMGAAKYEKDASGDEYPQHEVTIKPFSMGKFQITQAQWRAIALTPKIDIDLKPDPSIFKGDNRPVEGVSWHEVVEFCKRLSRETGRDYRLPSEAEWEYTCRARTTTPFNFGETITGELANYNASYTYADEPKGQYRQQTTPVGQFPPNAFGLYDMHGNVYEWCEDDWHDNYKGAPTDGSAWLNKNDNRFQFKLLRGGSGHSYPPLCRSAYRGRVNPDYSIDNFGLRVVASSRT